MQSPSVRRRFIILMLCFFALFVTSGLELYVQRQHHVISSKAGKTAHFLLINIHVLVIILVLYLITRHSIKIFIERDKELPGTAFKRNLFFAFTLFSVMPSFFIFFTAGKFITISINDDSDLQSLKNPIRSYYITTFILITLLILFLSMWCAFYLARGISTPIESLLKAMKEIKAGNFDIHIDVPPHSDLYTLLHGFNDMTQTLKNAQSDLEAKTKEMSLIVQHIKPVMLLINKFGRIIMCNDAAQKLLLDGFRIKNFLNKKIYLRQNDLHTMLLSLVRKLYAKKKNQIIQEIIVPINGESRTFMMQLTIITLNRGLNDHQKGLLVTLEDLTQIVKESKLKTWQEAAKQMAHEIKNPLTPIQLSTQRLQRKYQTHLNNDPVFMECTTMILNQVGIIKNLASHFSEFASLPTPCIDQIDLHAIIKETITLYNLSYPDIVFSTHLVSPLHVVKSDKRKLQRVFVNLFDNSIRALRMVNHKKVISIATYQEKKSGFLKIIIHDNGPGIPGSVKDTLFLPHVSTDKKNMGLGLAIVHDSIVQLGGTISLMYYKTGATFQILLPP